MEGRAEGGMGVVRGGERLREYGREGGREGGREHGREGFGFRGAVRGAHHVVCLTPGRLGAATGGHEGSCTRGCPE